MPKGKAPRKPRRNIILDALRRKDVLDQFTFPPSTVPREPFGTLAAGDVLTGILRKKQEMRKRRFK